MKDFKEFYSADGTNPDIDAVPMNFDDEISEAMWQFIINLDDVILESLTDDQLANYVEIIEAVSDGPDYDESETTSESDLEEGLRVTYSWNDGVLKWKSSDGKHGSGPKGDKMPKEPSEKDVKNFVKDIVGTTNFKVELAEALPAKRVRRDILQKRKASREHRKVKAKRKIEGRRKRKTAKFKRFKKKAKRLGKRGLTSTGKRKRTFINKG